MIRNIERILLLLVLLCFGMGARAGNVLTIGSAQGAPGDEVTLSLQLDNTDEVAALQVSIALGEQLSYVSGSAEVCSRGNGHSVTAGMKDGELNVMVYSMGMNALTGNSGDVVTLRLKLGNLPGDYALSVSKLILTDTDGNTIGDASATGGTVSIRCAKAEYSPMTIDFGSVPIRSTYEQAFTVTNTGNEPLEVTGLQFSNYQTKFSSTTQFPLTVAAGASASINITYAPEERGTISETVKVLCNSISKLNNITLKAQPFAVNELHVQPTSGIADEIVTILLTMNNMDAISGFQIEFTLPDALEFVENSFQLSERKTNHVTVVTNKNGVLKILVYSPSDAAFTGDDGEIGSFQVKLVGRNSVNLKPTKTVLTATIDNKVENVCSEVYGASITINSPRIFAGSTLNMGATPVTEVVEKPLSIRNSGNALLTINRVVFDKENFSIKEQLPLTIAAWQAQNLTVVCDSIDEGDFETTMQIYSNDPEQRVWNVNVTGNRFAHNYLTFEAADINTDDPLAVDVALNNYDGINGIQFDVEYPSSYFVPTDELETTARAAGFSVAQRAISTNTTRYFFYSLSDAPITSGEGKILTFKFTQKENTPAGRYTLNISNVKLGTSDMVDKYAGKDASCSFEVIDVLLGDVNGDGFIGAADVSAMINHILKRPNTVFIFKNADMNSDGTISATDVSALINVILHKN